jgi:RNA:NAD 2'-phosphotransferase (TPT1/KptA family)
VLHFLVLTDPEGKRLSGILRYRWMDIKVELRKRGWGGVDWIFLV